MHSSRKKPAQAALMLCALAPLAALPQAFPSKPVRVVTQFAAGSGGDALLRAVTASAADALGQPMLIENRAGAGGVLAAETVLRAAPDGYTLLHISTTVTVVRVAAGTKMSFDPQKDLLPMTVLGITPSVVVANASVPVNSFAELLDYAKKNPGKLSYGTSGVGSSHHLAAEQIKMLTGIDMVHVPYKAGAQATLDIISGQLPVAFIISAEALAHLKTGKIKLLATREDKRLRMLPDLPAVVESVPGYEAPPGWSGLFTAAGVPQPVFRRLHADIVKSMRTPEATARINKAGFEVVANTPEEMAAHMKREIALVARIAKATGIQLGD